MDNPAANASHINRTMGQPANELEGAIIASMRTVYDPEIPINIYDLGLVYEILNDGENKITVKMTLTAPNCPAAGILPGQVEKAVKETPGVAEATVDIVWEPQWGRETMSEAAALELGML